MGATSWQQPGRLAGTLALEVLPLRRAQPDLLLNLAREPLMRQVEKIPPTVRGFPSGMPAAIVTASLASAWTVSDQF